MRLYIAAIVTVMTLLMATPVAHGTTAIDIGVPSSFPLSIQASATDENGTAIGVSGNVDIVRSGGNIYLSVPTKAAEGANLSILDDPESSISYRNHTMYLPIRYGGQWAANLVAATDNMTCRDGRFYGQVTGLELDTAEVSTNGGSNFSAMASIFLNGLPEAATYRIALLVNDTIAKAVKAAGGEGEVFIVEVTGYRPGDRSTIGNTILRMRVDSTDTNLAVYRYVVGAEKIDSHIVDQNGAMTVETIHEGPGIYALAGPGLIRPPETGPGFADILIIVAALIILLAALAYMVMRILKLKKEDKKS